MKINEIKVGDILWFGGPVLVLDIGTYNVYRDPSIPRDITVKGLTVRSDVYWKHDSSIKQRRVVILQLTNNQMVVSISAQKLSSTVGIEDKVKEALVQAVAAKASRSEQDKWERRQSEYTAAIREICMAVAGFDDERNLPWQVRHGDGTDVLAANKELMSKMLLLWLQYHQQTGQEVAGARGEDIESMVDSLRDALRGLKDAAQAAPNLNSSSDRYRIEAQAKIDAGWNTPSFSVADAAKASV